MRARGAVLAWLCCAGCAPATVTRVVDGETVEGRPVRAEAYAAYVKAELFAARGDRKHALEALATALDRDPGSPELVTRYGEVLCEDAAGPDALARFDRALSLDPEYAPAFLGRARCLSRLGNAAEALVAAERAAALDPMSLDSTRLVATLLFRRGRTERAWLWLEARALLEPGARGPQKLLLEAAERERDTFRADKARRALAGASVRSAKPADSVKVAGVRLDPLGALERAERRLAADPEDTNAWTAALAAADLLGDEARFLRILGTLGEEPLPASPAALAALTELLAHRCGPEAAAALTLAARPDSR